MKGDTELPKGIDEINDLFFGGDHKKPLDFSKGRIKKEEKNDNLLIEPEDDIDEEPERNHLPQVSLSKDQQKEKKKLSKQEEKELLKHATFVRKLQEKIEKRKADEQKFLIQKESRQRIKEKLKEKLEERKKIPYIGLYKYTSIGGDYCIHDDAIKHIFGGVVTSSCKKCSRQKEWPINEWENYILGIVNIQKEQI